MRRSVTPWAALAGSLTLTIAAFAFVLVTGRSRDDARFERAVSSAQDRIETRFQAYLSFLLDSAAVFGADPSLGSGFFRAYIARSRIQERYPGLQAVALSRPFRRAETERILAELRPTDRRGIWPDEGRDERSAVVWIEPLDLRNRQALGFDMLLEPNRSAAMVRARDTGEPALTARLRLVQEIDPGRVQAGFILFVPVFRGGSAPATVEARRSDLLGWLAAVFRGDDLFYGIFGRERPQVDFQVFDGETTDRAALLHDGIQPPAAKRTEVVQLVLAGRPWTVVFTPTAELLGGSGDRVALLVLFAGLGFSVVIFLLSRREAVARERAERAVEGLREADRRKDEFLAVLGHELRNPLAPLVTAIELRKLGRGSPRVDAVIERQTRQMVHLVDDLLDVARISRGKIELRRSTFDAGEAIRRAVEGLLPVAHGRDLELSVADPPEPLQIDADPTRFDQIVTNLVSNAIKYTEKGGRVDVSSRAADGSFELRVRDSGIGVAPEMLDQLFKPFVQVGARDYATGGLGIGLALVRGLVEVHGGTVSAHSEGLGRGAEFVVRLPAARETPKPVPAAIAEEPPGRGRVLVIDDNVDAAETLAEALRLEGHEVRVAHDGRSGVLAAQEFEPALVLLDIGLPGASGYEVIGDLRRIPALRTAVIAALTGFGQASDRARAIEAGFDEHLVKPVELAEVRALLRRRVASAQRPGR